MYAYMLTVVGLICFLEGLPYLAAPDKVRKWIKWLLSSSNSSIRALGAALMILGLLLVYLGRKHGG